MELNRRRFLQASGFGAAGLFMAACGKRDTGTTTPSAGSSSATAAATSGASGSSSSAVGKIDLKGAPVAALFTSLNNDYYASWDLGAKRAVQAMGGEYRPFTNEGDPAKQISQFEQQVEAGAKIFFMTAPDPADTQTIAKMATEKGVFLTNTWEASPFSSPFDYGDGYVTYFTPRSEQAGYEVAKALFEKMGGKGNLVHLTGHPGSTPDTQRTLGVDRALAEYPNIKMIARQPGEWNRDDSRKAMAGIITKYGKEIKGVFGQNDDVGIGAVNALSEAGITGVPVTGIDGNKGTMDLVKAGSYFGSYSSLPFWQAGFSAVRSVDAFLGVKFTPLDRQVWTDGLFVTKDNVDSYLSVFFGDKDPYDWQLMSRYAHPTDWDPQNGIHALDLIKMWTGFDKQKPSGWKAPATYTAEASKIGATDKEWAAHWKIKLP
jgi:ribose transport system substrate-binding protein